jgi:hypothetical protein
MTGQALLLRAMRLLLADLEAMAAGTKPWDAQKVELACQLGVWHEARQAGA